MITNELNKYIRNIIKPICKTLHFKALLTDDMLYIVRDKTQLYFIPVNGIPMGTVLAFDSESLGKNEDYIMEADCFHYVLNKVQIYSEIVNRQPSIYTCDDLRADPIFQQFVTRKAADGAGMYFMMDIDGNRTPITIFGSLFNLNKDDKAGVDLYELQFDNKGRIALAVFHIYKANLRLRYDLYMRIMGF